MEMTKAENEYISTLRREVAELEKERCVYCMSPISENGICSVCGLNCGDYVPEEHHLPPGTVLAGRYLVGKALGGGGFGITYLGYDQRLDRKVAIKEYFPTDNAFRLSKLSLEVSCYTGNASHRFEERKIKFIREARTMARLEKLHAVVGVRDFFEQHNTAYIIMEYIEGTTLRELTAQKGGHIPVGELFPLLEPLFGELDEMHSQSLIHRDISPENLMLERGQIRLLDFGCAREAGTITETMTIALKSGFAPIEQYQHKGQGPWTDVYALSATIYYCLTGKVPEHSIDRICKDELILPRRLGVEIGVEQEQALLYGMGIRPRRRFQSVRDLHDALYLN